jgi:hypothetical protein
LNAAVSVSVATISPRPLYRGVRRCWETLALRSRVVVGMMMRSMSLPMSSNPCWDCISVFVGRLVCLVAARLCLVQRGCRSSLHSCRLGRIKPSRYTTRVSSLD